MHTHVHAHPHTHTLAHTHTHTHYIFVVLIRSARIEPEPRQFVGVGNSTAYPEVTNTPIVATKDLVKVPKSVREKVMVDLQTTDPEFESSDFVKDDLGADAKTDTIDDKEEDQVFFWLQNHPDIYKEIRHQLKRFPAVLDFTPGDGTFGLVCLQDRAKYVPIPTNSDHRDVLDKIWADWIGQKVLNQDHPMHVHTSTMSWGQALPRSRQKHVSCMSLC